jgi:hypothetical protein
MTIPDEAVEAALEVFWEKEDLTYMEAMRAALEAAAPYLLIAAWDEGYTVGNAHNGRRDANPYRNEA